MGKSNLDSERTEHPSFGVVSIGKASIGGGAKRLFDSPFKHYHIITLEIAPAALVRSLHGDTIMHAGRVPYIQIAMSQVQFAEMVLNTGMHSGTPCTVEYVNGKSVPEPPENDLKKLWAKEVKKDFKDVADAATEAEKVVQDLLAKDRITKGDVKALADIIRTLAQDVRENIPWMHGRFEEAMDKAVAEAKGEINAHLSNLVTKAGLSALKYEDIPRIEMQGDVSQGGTPKR